MNGKVANIIDDNIANTVTIFAEIPTLLQNLAIGLNNF